MKSITYINKLGYLAIFRSGSRLGFKFYCIKFRAAALRVGVSKLTLFQTRYPMKCSSLSQVSLALAFLAIASVAHAKGKSTTPTREQARCHSVVSLCDQVATDDYKRCQSAGQSHCSENYYEDVNQCTSDFNSCMDKASAAVIIGSEAGAVLSPN